MQKLFPKDFQFVLFAFLSWRIFLFLVSWVVLWFFPPDSHTNFLGGGYLNYIQNPYLFSFANFDGEHYLSVAIFGYKELEQAFFPIYPMLINITSKWFFYDLTSSWIASTISGILISNISFLLSLFVLKRLIELDFSSQIAKLTIIITLVFPTSFYFGMVYSESLFLLVVLLSFYFLRTNKIPYGSLMGGLASAIRVLGILLLPAFLIEIYYQKKWKFFVFSLIIPLGLIAYMYYQYILTGDPLAFYHLQTTIGQQRQSNLILLPQVIFRYLKILINADPLNPIYQTVIIELLSTLGFLTLLFLGFFKNIRLSYLIFGLSCLLLSPLQGSLTSMPRYVLVVFPGFLTLALILEKRKILRCFVLVLFSVLLTWEMTLYLKGIWVA